MKSQICFLGKIRKYFNVSSAENFTEKVLVFHKGAMMSGHMRMRRQGRIFERVVWAVFLQQAFRVFVIKQNHVISEM